MAVILYGDGTQYGGAGALYELISTALLDAQSAQLRSTGLEVSIIDERTNRWEPVTLNGNIDPTGYTAASKAAGHDDARFSTYHHYRGQASLVQLDNGDIIRVRVGSGVGDYSDRKIYTQTITDPSVAAQWESWNELYSGDHVAVKLVKTGASTYDVYHSKLGAGICKNNSVLFAAATDLVQLDQTVHIIAVQADDFAHDEYLVLVVAKPSTYDELRKLDHYIMPTNATQPFFSNWNFEWYRNMGAILDIGGDWLSIRSFPIYQHPRVVQNGESITVTRIPSEGIGTLADNATPRIIRGLAGKAGHNTITMGGITSRQTDGFYYLFYYELHRNDDWESIQSGPFLFWQRSKDGLYWSEPVLIGITLSGYAGVFEDAGYLYIAGNGRVLRRPTTSVSYPIQNYVPTVQYEIPRENQESSGTLVIANPAGVNDPLLNLSDRRIIIRPGIRVEGGSYEYEQTSDFWIKNIKEVGQAKTSRLHIALGDVWTRLSQPLRDNFNVIGKTIWNDWNTGLVNEEFNYYFSTGTPTLVEAYKLQVADVAGGLVMWTGWKGHNPDFSISFNTKPVRFYARWINDENNIRFDYVGTTLTITNVIGGIETQVDSQNIGTQSRLRFRLRWGQIAVYAVSGLLFTLQAENNLQPVIRQGYVGWGADTTVIFHDFVFEDWEQDITTHDLIRYSLAMGDYHDVIVGGPNERQYAMVWGPQTDLPTAGDGLRQVLETTKSQLIWREGVIEIGLFTDLVPSRILEDEVFDTNYVDDANRRINFAVVDGNEHSWLEGDGEDSRARDRQIVAYFDLPEILTQDGVTERAREEIRQGQKGQSPGGRIPLMLDIRRMDPLTLIDNIGRSFDVRVEGIRVDINQSNRPSQYMELDTSLL